jgi:hypothetical protein
MFIFGACLYLVATFAACSLPNSRTNSTSNPTNASQSNMDDNLGPDPSSFLDGTELPRGEKA